MQDIHKDLLSSGLNINEMNMIRKAISKVKNGGLLDYISTDNIIQFVTCDIPNERLADVSSGPLLYTDLDYQKVSEYLKKYEVNVSKKSRAESEFPTYKLNSASILLGKLKKELELDYNPIVYDDLLENVLEDISKNLNDKIHISGGEATLKLPSKCGVGGRNTHFVLAMANKLYKDTKNQSKVIFSLGTDGADGPTDAAGAYIDYSTFKKSIDQGINPVEYMNSFDSYSYFKKIGTLIKTGPTHSNLMDIRIIKSR